MGGRRSGELEIHKVWGLATPAPISTSLRGPPVLPLATNAGLSSLCICPDVPVLLMPTSKDRFLSATPATNPQALLFFKDLWLL